MNAFGYLIVSLTDSGPTFDMMEYFNLPCSVVSIERLPATSVGSETRRSQLNFPIGCDGGGVDTMLETALATDLHCQPSLFAQHGAGCVCCDHRTTVSLVTQLNNNSK